MPPRDRTWPHQAVTAPSVKTFSPSYTLRLAMINLSCPTPGYLVSLLLMSLIYPLVSQKLFIEVSFLQEGVKIEKTKLNPKMRPKSTPGTKIYQFLLL